MAVAAILKNRKIAISRPQFHLGYVSVVNIAFFMIFAFFDPSPLTVYINCSFFYIYCVYNSAWLSNLTYHIGVLSVPALYGLQGSSAL